MGSTRGTLGGLAGGGDPAETGRLRPVDGREEPRAPAAPLPPAALSGRSHPARGLEGGNLTLKAGLGLNICKGRSRHMKTLTLSVWMRGHSGRHERPPPGLATAHDSCGQSPTHRPPSLSEDSSPPRRTQPPAGLRTAQARLPPASWAPGTRPPWAPLGAGWGPLSPLGRQRQRLQEAQGPSEPLRGRLPVSASRALTAQLGGVSWGAASPPPFVSSGPEPPLTQAEPGGVSLSRELSDQVSVRCWQVL